MFIHDQDGLGSRSSKIQIQTNSNHTTIAKSDLLKGLIYKMTHIFVSGGAGRNQIGMKSCQSKHRPDGDETNETLYYSDQDCQGVLQVIDKAMAAVFIFTSTIKRIRDEITNTAN